VFPGHLSNASLHGPLWLTGGSTGPEGSIFSFVIMGILAAVVHFLYPAKSSPPALLTASLLPEIDSLGEAEPPSLPGNSA
jgi:hypothetical protein